MMADLYFGGSVWCNIDIALRRLEPIYGQETEILGLSVIEWYVLRTLYEEDGQTAGRLAEAAGRSAASFTLILDTIQDMGLIEQCQLTADRQARHIYLTAKDKALEGQVKASAKRIEKRINRGLFNKDRQGYERVLADLQMMTP